ncbi:hypothetical protein GCM10022381_29270 [Leifsonia kafniensis]|uniref:Ricin B lectin domain-containing protein n=1 Tax=Leifsonia kafniensis TaxID=475957 RepID=A0ABP7KTZ6_9MICO
MNRFTKIAVAVVGGAAALALVLGGGETLASWTSSLRAESNTITSGSLTTTASVAAPLTTTFSGSALSATGSFTIANTGTVSGDYSTAVTLGNGSSAPLAGNIALAAWPVASDTACTASATPTASVSGTLAAAPTLTGSLPAKASVVYCLRTTLTSASGVSSGSTVSATITATTTVGGWTSAASSSFVQTLADATVPTVPMPVDTGTWYQLVNTKSKACVAASPSSAGNGSEIFQIPKCGQLGAANESWLFTAAVTNGYTTVSNGLASSSLVWGPNGASTGAGAQIQMQTAVGSAAQQWKPVKLGTGLYQLVTLASGLCLSTDGSSSYGSAMQQQACDSANTAQTFSLNSTGVTMTQATIPPNNAAALSCTSDGWNAYVSFAKPTDPSNSTTYQVTANGVTIATGVSDWYPTAQIARDNLPSVTFSPGRYTIVITRVQANGTSTLVGSGTVAVGLPTNRTYNCG